MVRVQNGARSRTRGTGVLGVLNLRLFQHGFKVADAALQCLYQRLGFMFRGRSHNKVFGSVVVSDAVDVMDIFTLLQSSAKNTLHHDAMFKLTLTGPSVHHDVAVSFGESTAFPKRMIRATRTAVVALGSAWNTSADQPNENRVLSDTCSLRDFQCRQSFGIHPNDVSSVDEVRHVLANLSTDHAGALKPSNDKCLAGIEPTADRVRTQSALVQPNDLICRNVFTMVSPGNRHTPIIQEIY